MYISHLEKNFHRVGVFLLGVMVLFSTFGFTVSSHFCGSIKVKSAIGFVKTELTCGMKKKISNCPEHNQVQTSCCQNEFEYHHIEDNTKKEQVEFSNSNISIKFYPLTAKSDRFVSVKPKEIYKPCPPLIVRNITIFHQTFLI